MKKILVVDNDKKFLKFMEYILLEAGHRVVTADDGLSALDVLKSYTPDIVFVDIIMPNIDGKQLCKIIRGMQKLKDVYLFILSAISAEEKMSASDLGVHTCIAKGPFNEMRQNILDVLDQTDQPAPRVLSEEVIGIKSIYPRRITTELLGVKKHFEMILETMSDAILEINSSGRIVYANRMALSLSNRSMEELLGSYWVELFSGVAHQRIVERMRTTDGVLKTAAEDEPLHLNAHWVKLNIFPINQDGTNKIVILNDVTEQMMKEAALRESKDLYQRLFENTGAATVTFGDDLMVTKCNEEFAKLSGYLKEDIEGKMKLSDFVHPADLNIMKDGYRKRGQGEKAPAVYEFRWIGKDRKTRYMLNRIAVFSDTSERISSLIDITDRIEAEKDRKQLEVKLWQAQKMQAVGTLAGGIAHDFNNILAGIIGYTELADLHLDNGSRAKECLRQVLNASERAKGLVKQILTFSRQSKQKQVPVPISPIIKEALKLLRASLSINIEIREDIARNLGLVETDPTQIHQVLMNLCSNATHAMQAKGGILEIKLSRTEIDATFAKQSEIRPGPYVCLAVSDKGHGILPEMLERIFDPYYTTKEDGEGTGLGLAVVYEIVKKCNGSIIVESEIEKGSTFYVYFPIVGNEKDEIIKNETELFPTGHERILLVDDNQDLVDIGKEKLEHLGYNVSATNSSKKALELFREQPEQFDMLITDMTMPYMTGAELAEKFMKIRPDIPVVLCTGYSETLTEEKSRIMGIREYLMKPLSIIDLAKTIRRVLDNRSY
ncbi:MAG: response regulator [Deltaproteobacteria bacterium]|nr:response regulator [Deltaproteobacteria bacterium]